MVPHDVGRARHQATGWARPGSGEVHHVIDEVRWHAAEYGNAGPLLVLFVEGLPDPYGRVREGAAVHSRVRSADRLEPEGVSHAPLDLGDLGGVEVFGDGTEQRRSATLVDAVELR